MRLRWTTAPVLPAIPTFPVCSTSNAVIAVLVRLRSSCDSPPRVVACAFWYSVTANAIALSRHRFSVRKSSVLMGAANSTARSVTD